MKSQLNCSTSEVSTTVPSELASAAASHPESNLEMADLLCFKVSADTAGAKHLGVEVDSDSQIFTISSSTSDFGSELRPPNARDGDMENILQVINGGD